MCHTQAQTNDENGMSFTFTVKSYLGKGNGNKVGLSLKMSD
jgi:hypothetical protein